MKNYLFLLVFILISFCLTCQTTRVISYNIRYDCPTDGPNNWKLRKAELVGQIKTLHPHIICIQEGLINQVQYIDSCLTDFTYVGVGREDGISSGEFAAIFIDTSKFSIIKSGNFWLSETHEKPSKGWDADHKRICTWVKILNKSNSKSLWVFNTHFDHAGQKARKESSKLIASEVNNLVSIDDAIVIAGDLNCSPKDNALKPLFKEFNDSYRTAENVKFQHKGTFNNFDKNYIPDERIDYILIKNLKVKKYEHRYDTRIDGYFFSDHLPVIVDAYF
jgi:endonuclease/exonuclease/phosphatase family metal-dependent hydrolase